MSLITQAETQERIAAVQDLWREYITWTDALLDPEVRHLAPTFEGFEEELASLPGLYAPPGGRLLLAAHESQPAGTVALKPHSADEGELKRLYVRPGFRGHGIGNALVKLLMTEAHAIGYKRIVLDSHISMKSAHTIYQSHGFYKVPHPADFPEFLKPWVVFMQCDLAA